MKSVAKIEIFQPGIVMLAFQTSMKKTNDLTDSIRI